MRGSLFLAVFLILVGLTLVVATMRGRAPQFWEVLGSVAMGTKGGRAGSQNQAPRRSA